MSCTFNILFCCCVCMLDLMLCIVVVVDLYALCCCCCQGDSSYSVQDEAHQSNRNSLFGWFKKEDKVNHLVRLLCMEFSILSFVFLYTS